MIRVILRCAVFPAVAFLVLCAPAVRQAAVELPPSDANDILTTAVEQPPAELADLEKLTGSFAGDVVVVPEAGSGSGGGAALPRTNAAVALNENLVDSIDAQAPFPQLAAPPVPGGVQGDKRCGAGDLGRLQCRMIDLLMSRSMTRQGIRFRAEDIALSKDIVEELLDVGGWELLASSLSIFACALKTTHDRATVVRRATYSLFVVVEAETIPGSGLHRWQSATNLGDTSKVFTCAPNSTNDQGFDTSRATLPFRYLSGLSVNASGSTTRQQTKPEEKLDRFLRSVCHRPQSQPLTTTCSALSGLGGGTLIEERDPVEFPRRDEQLQLGYDWNVVALSWLGLILAGLNLETVSTVVEDAISDEAVHSEEVADIGDEEATDTVNSENSVTKEEANVAERVKNTSNLLNRGRFMRINVLLALLIAIISQSALAIMEIVQRLRSIYRGWISLKVRGGSSFDTVSGRFYAVELFGEVAFMKSTVPIHSFFIVIPTLLYGLYLLLGFLIVADPMFNRFSDIHPRMGKVYSLGRAACVYNYLTFHLLCKKFLEHSSSAISALLNRIQPKSAGQGTTKS